MKNLKMRDEMSLMELSLQKAKIVLEGAVQDIDDNNAFIKKYAPEAIRDAADQMLGDVTSIELDIVHDYIYKTLEKLRVLCGELDAEREAERAGNNPAA